MYHESSVALIVASCYMLGVHVRGSHIGLTDVTTILTQYVYVFPIVVIVVPNSITLFNSS